MAIDGVPERVGKYRVDQVIGRGALGVVFKGYDEQIDRTLAIKTLRSEVFNDVSDPESFLKRFTAEAQSAARCLHPNIVTVFDFVEQSRRPYIIMEYVNAGTLADVIQTGALVPIRQVGEIMAQILLALDHAHSKGVIHRDIKPSNILCPSATSIKVTDFGVARLDSLELTRPGGWNAAGTPNYMAPERFLGRTADVRTDIFSAGVILYQLLTGRKPFFANELSELMHKLMNEATPSVMALRPELWSEIDGVVQKALARNPKDRFQTADHFIDALNAAIECRPHENSLPLDLTELSRTTTEKGPLSASKAEAVTETMASHLSVGAVEALGRTLTPWLGPIAKVLVKQTLKETSDVGTLVTSLSRHIKCDAEITKFRQTAEKMLRDDLGLEAARVQEAISEQEIKAATDVLVSIVGPIARLMVVREAQTAVGRDDFYRRLAERVPDERTKTRVLQLRQQF